SVACITMSEKGSVVVAGPNTWEIPAHPTEVIDTTGAGDLYAAGFLYGYTQGRPLPECGRLGALAAAEVISHIGARPQVPLSSLVTRASAGVLPPGRDLQDHPLLLDRVGVVLPGVAARQLVD